MSQVGVNVVMKGLCDDTADGDMNKFLQTEPGKVFLRPRTRHSTALEFDLQKAERLSLEGYLASKQHREIKVEEASNDVEDSAKRARDCDAAIKRYMKAGLTYDQAASKAHRDEKDGGQPRINGGWREPTGANLNPKVM